MSEINYVAVIFAALANIIVGFLWFGPLFGKKWVRTGQNKDMVEAQKVKDTKGKGYLTTSLALLGSLLMSYLLAQFLALSANHLRLDKASLGFTIGFWVWLGLVIPLSFGRILWDGKPWGLFDSKAWKHWLILNSYYLVSLLLMSCILVTFNY